MTVPSVPSNHGHVSYAAFSLMETTVTARSEAPPRKPLEHPSGDKRFKILEVFIKRLQHRQDMLIEVLHKAQELFGFLDNDLLIYVAQQLRLPPSRVFGVATFYHYFTLKPKGAHTCVVCMGTACYVRGAGKLLEDVAESLHVNVGETTPDGLYTLEACRCLGVCSQAPAVMIDEDVVGKVSLKTFMHALKDYQ